MGRTRFLIARLTVLILAEGLVRTERAVLLLLHREWYNVVLMLAIRTAKPELVVIAS